MLIKLINSGIIVLCSTLIGLEISKKIRFPYKRIECFTRGFVRLETEIIHYASRLPDALVRIENQLEVVPKVVP